MLTSGFPQAGRIYEKHTEGDKREAPVAGIRGWGDRLFRPREAEVEGVHPELDPPRARLEHGPGRLGYVFVAGLLFD